MTDPMLPLAGLSPVDGKAVVAKFDGGLLSSDGGVLALREAEQRLGVADRLAACWWTGARRIRSRTVFPMSFVFDC
jgi:Transposase DDE domain group 1